MYQRAQIFQNLSVQVPGSLVHNLYMYIQGSSRWSAKSFLNLDVDIMLSLVIVCGHRSYVYPVTCMRQLEIWGCGEHRRSWEFPDSGLDKQFRFVLVFLHQFPRCTGQTEYTVVHNLGLARIGKFNIGSTSPTLLAYDMIKAIQNYFFPKVFLNSKSKWNYKL